MLLYAHYTCSSATHPQTVGPSSVIGARVGVGGTPGIPAMRGPQP